jgi:hypothetical protein
MKRLKFIQHLKSHDCFLEREGANHSVYQNRKNNLNASVPRHADIPEMLVNKICKELQIPKAFKK